MNASNFSFSLFATSVSFSDSDYFSTWIQFSMNLILNISVLHISASVICDELLTGRQVVAEQNIKHFKCLFFVIRKHRNKPSRFRIHGSLPHHVRLVFAQSL